jgi:hypothetical protein
MKSRTQVGGWMVGPLVGLTLVVGVVDEAAAHCDTMSGPVVGAARQALESGNLNLVLIWVQPEDELVLREEFDRARADRVAGGAVGIAADRRFFEALVRIHRAGEGAPYTGIKPEGTEVEPAVAAADRSLAAGSVEPVRAVLEDAVRSGIERHFQAVTERQGYDPDDVEAGRAYVRSYVEYTHFAEGLYDKAVASSAHHGHADQERGGGHEGHAAGDEGHGPGREALGAHDTAGADAGDTNHTANLPWVLVAFLGLAVIGESSFLVWRNRDDKARTTSGNERSKP